MALKKQRKIRVLSSFLILSLLFLSGLNTESSLHKEIHERGIAHSHSHHHDDGSSSSHSFEWTQDLKDHEGEAHHTHRFLPDQPVLSQASHSHVCGKVLVYLETVNLPYALPSLQVSCQPSLGRAPPGDFFSENIFSAQPNKAPPLS